MRGKTTAIILGVTATVVLVSIGAVCALRVGQAPPSAASLPVPLPRRAEPSPLSAETGAKPALPSTVAKVAPKPRRPALPDAAKPADPAALLAKINELGPSNLPLTVELARDALARFPDSPTAPEFAMNLAKALLHMGRVDEAREEARRMLRNYPDSPFTREVEHHLLTNPPNPPR
jgi:hypothetical protein